MIRGPAAAIDNGWVVTGWLGIGRLDIGLSTVTAGKVRTPRTCIRLGLIAFCDVTFSFGVICNHALFTLFVSAVIPRRFDVHQTRCCFG